MLFRLFTFLLILCLYQGALKAQKGTVLVYGNASFYKFKNKEAKVLNWNVFAGTGYQFSEKWTIGLEIGKSKMKTQQSDDEFKLMSFKIGPFVQYFKTINDRIGFFTTFDAGYAQFSEADNPDVRKFYCGIYPAIYVFIGKDWGAYLIPASLEINPIYKLDASLVFNMYPIIGISKNIAIKK